MRKVRKGRGIRKLEMEGNLLEFFKNSLCYTYKEDTESYILNLFDLKLLPKYQGKIKYTSHSKYSQRMKGKNTIIWCRRPSENTESNYHEMSMEK